MIRELLSRLPLQSVALTGQLLFLAIFLAVLARVFRKGARPHYDTIAKLPLETHHEQ